MKFFSATVIALGAALVASQTPNSCIPGRHFNDDDGYFIEGVAGLSTEENLDSAHGQKLPNSTWAPGILYPAGQFEVCNSETDPSCRAPCDTAPGCQQFYSSHTCAILQFCNDAATIEGQDVYLLPTQEALDNCDFNGATLVGNTVSSQNRQAGSCFEYPFEIDHELSTYYFSSPNGCQFGQKLAVTLQDYDETADTCAAIGLTTSRLKNCDCRLEKTPSTLGEPCRTEFSDQCFAVMQTDRPTTDCCETGTCISTLKDFEHPLGEQREFDRRETCDDDTPGLCYNVDGVGSDTNGLGSIDCCTKTCRECGTELAPFVEWKPCTTIDGVLSNCGFLGRYDREPYQCDFSLCARTDKWSTSGCDFKKFAGISDPDCGFVICFDGLNEAMVDGIATKMKDLKIGDRVLVDENGRYEEVLSFGHTSKNISNDYVHIHTQEAARPLVLSKEHMVFTEKNGAVAASSIKVGDLLVTINGSSAVTKVDYGKKGEGAYAPFTNSGTIVVNGVVSSCYIAMQKSDKLFQILSHQWLAHSFETPHRFYCRYNDCSNETYNEQGLSNWVVQPARFFSWVLQQGAWVQGAVMVPAVFLCAVFNVMELICSTSVILAATSLVILGFSNRKTSNKAKQQ